MELEISGSSEPGFIQIIGNKKPGAAYLSTATEMGMSEICQL